MERLSSFRKGSKTSLLLFSAVAFIAIAYCAISLYSAFKNRWIIEEISGMQLPRDAEIVSRYSKFSGLGISGVRILELSPSGLTLSNSQSCADVGYRDLLTDDIQRIPELKNYVTEGKRACIKQSSGDLDGFAIVQDKTLIVVALF